MKEHNGKRGAMKKLDDIEKKNIYSTPEGYFDELPGIIQSRVPQKSEKQPVAWVSLGLKYAVAAAIVLLIAYFGVFRNPASIETDYNSLLAEVSTVELIAYIETTDLTTDEILDYIDLDESAFNEIFEYEQEILDGITDDDVLLLEIDEMI